MPVYHLDIEDNYDFELVGISSHEKDYRLAWSLNKRMNWRLAHIGEIVVQQKYQQSRHAQFRYLHPVDETIITLIDNKTAEGFLLPELQQFDYVLRVDEMRSGLDDTFFRKLRSAPFVLTVFPLEISKLKSKQNLIYDHI